MSPFTSQLDADYLGPGPDGHEWWRLRSPLVYRFAQFAGEPLGTFTVPEFFETDLASIPWLFRLVCPKRGAWDRPAVLHDFLYRSKVVSRFFADAIFRDAMMQCGVPVWRRVVMYYAVRGFGWLYWGKAR